MAGATRSETSGAACRQTAPGSPQVAGAAAWAAASVCGAGLHAWNGCPTTFPAHAVCPGTVPPSGQTARASPLAGIAAVADCVREEGLLLGIYGDSGELVENSAT